MCCKSYAKRIVSFVLAILLGLLSTNFLGTANLQEILFNKIAQPVNKSGLPDGVKRKAIHSLCFAEPLMLAASGIEPIQIISQLKPSYTEAAQQNRIQGKINLQVTFQSNGKIGKIQVIQGLSHGLTEEAVSAVKQIKFRPLLSHGMPRTMSRKVECNFVLN